MRDGDDLALLEEAAHEAGRIAMHHFRGPLVVREKHAGQGPVTSADLAVDEMLRDRLCAARPHYGWLSEESAVAPHDREARRVFVVDPIDGTRAFIAGEPGFSHALAVVEDGRAVAGVVHLPARRETYLAARGHGARRNDEPIRASSRGELAGATALGAKPQFRAELWPGGAPPCKRHFRPSLAWRMCLVASGRFDLMLTLRPAHDWDVAAGGLIAEEAGAVVTDADGRPLVLAGPEAIQPGVIAAPPALHRQLMALRRVDGGSAG